MAAQRKRKRNLTPEQRQAASERAKAMHEIVVVDPETGLERRKFGGPQPGSGPKRRIATSVREAAEERMEDLIDALFAGVGANQTAAERRRAATNIITIARQEEKDEADERRDELEQARRAEVYGRILQRLGVSGSEDPDMVLDADFAEIEEAEVDGEGDDPPALPPPS